MTSFMRRYSCVFGRDRTESVCIQWRTAESKKTDRVVDDTIGIRVRDGENNRDGVVWGGFKMMGRMFNKREDP